LRKVFSIISRISGTVFLVLIIYVLSNSSLDIYNNFAYDKAIVRESPYGFIPMLVNPVNYRNTSGQIKSGDFVYVQDWISADNGRITFAKVKSGLNEGYINRELLTQTNINVKPVISVLLLMLIFFYFSRRVYFKLHSRYSSGSHNKFNADYIKYQVH